MVPAQNLQLVRDAHATPCAAAAAAGRQLGVTTAPRPSHRYMAQEPVDQKQHHHEPSSKPPPPQQPQQADQDQEARRHPGHGDPQEAAGTSGGNGGAGDWLRLGLAPAAATSPGAAVFGGPPTGQAPPASLPAAPPAAFLHHAIPQASIALPVPRAGPPWLPPWSPAPPPPLLPFGHHYRAFYTPGAAAAASGGLDAIRVVLPPSAVAAAAAGVWFALQAAPYQGREPFLPQIPRCYLRIKDGRVTIRLLTKYLAAKLGLEDESEVEITCRGRPLSSLLTLQQVRDGIWWQGDAAISPSVAPDLSSANHLMVLQYGRRPS